MKAISNRIAAARGIWSFIDLVRHPEHLDRVFEIADAMLKQHIDILEKVRDHHLKDPVGAAAIRDRVRLNINLNELGTLPKGTLGREFADHMRANKLDPSDLPHLGASDELEFVRAHFYETHDVWHVVTGFNTEVAGELGLQAFYTTQGPGGLPWALLAMGFLNTAFYAMDDRERRADAIGRGWEMGKKARAFFGVRWDTLWNTPLAEVRAMLNVEPYVGSTRSGATN